MNTHQLIQRMENTNHAHLQRLAQCIRDAVRREDWDAVIALAKIARTMTAARAV